MMKLILALFSALFVENYVFTKYYGLCPFLGTSKSVTGAFGMGVCVIGVTTLSGAIIWPLYRFFILPFDLLYLTTPLFLVVIAFLVQVLEMILQKLFPRLFASMGIYLPLICVNCVIIAALRTVSSDFNTAFTGFFSGVFTCFCASLSFLFALVLFAGVRKKIQDREIPPAFRGTPMVLISAGLCAIAFYAFSLLNF